jgi:hypothetical protein
LIKQAYDAGIDDAVVDVRAISDVAQDPFVHKPLQLV